MYPHLINHLFYVIDSTISDKNVQQPFSPRPPSPGTSSTSKSTTTANFTDACSGTSATRNGTLTRTFYGQKQPVSTTTPVTTRTSSTDKECIGTTVTGQKRKKPSRASTRRNKKMKIKYNTETLLLVC